MRLAARPWLALDQELFERTAPVAKGRLERLAAARMAISTGSGWLTGPELGELMEQLKDAVPVED